MLKKRVDGLEDYYYQWMNKYKDDADRLRELLRRLEWTPLYFSTLKKIVYTCVICNQSKEDGHTADCELYKNVQDKE